MFSNFNDELFHLHLKQEICNHTCVYAFNASNILLAHVGICYALNVYSLTNVKSLQLIFKLDKRRYNILVPMVTYTDRHGWVQNWLEQKEFTEISSTGWFMQSLETV